MQLPIFSAAIEIDFSSDSEIRKITVWIIAIAICIFSEHRVRIDSQETYSIIVKTLI